MYQQMMGVLVLSVFSAVAGAANCENPRNTYDDVYCLNKIYASADNELNQNYQSLRSYLNTAQKNRLKTAQLAWIRQRDRNCSDDAANIVYVRCNLDQTVQRSAWLRERIRECKTVGCQNRQLSH